MDDRLRIYRDATGRWRWERISHHQPVAASPRSYGRQRTCLLMAVHSNRKPYVLVLEGGIEDDFESK